MALGRGKHTTRHTEIHEVKDVLFVDKSKDYYTNIDIVNKNKVSFFEVQEEYYRLLADGLSEKEIHSKMIEEYKTPKKGKTYEK